MPAFSALLSIYLPFDVKLQYYNFGLILLYHIFLTHFTFSTVPSKLFNSGAFPTNIHYFKVSVL